MAVRKTDFFSVELSITLAISKFGIRSVFKTSDRAQIPSTPYQTNRSFRLEPRFSVPCEGPGKGSATRKAKQEEKRVGRRGSVSGSAGRCPLGVAAQEAVFAYSRTQPEIRGPVERWYAVSKHRRCCAVVGEDIRAIGR